MTCSYSFSLRVFYENNKQYCLLAKYLTHSTRIDGRLYLQASAHSALGAADIATTLVCRLPAAFRPRHGIVSIVSHASYSEKR